MTKALFLKSATSPLIVKYVEINDDQSLSVRDETIFPLNAEHKASTELFNCIDQMLIKNSLDYSDIQQIFVASGPGSYTGARLLTTIVKTIVFLYPDIEVFDASLLNIFLSSSLRISHTKGKNLGIVPARRNKFYVAHDTKEEKQINQVMNTAAVEDFVKAVQPCHVNGVEMFSNFSITEINSMPPLIDWLTVSQQVEDIRLYEPYYLEDVNIG